MTRMAMHRPVDAALVGEREGDDHRHGEEQHGGDAEHDALARRHPLGPARARLVYQFLCN